MNVRAHTAMAMVLKWALVPLAVLGGFVPAGFLGGIASDLTGLWHLPGTGFCAAFAVVLVSYLAAPSHKLLSAFAGLLIGATAAWIVLEPSWYPESYGDGAAYQPTHLPILATYAGGILGLAVTLALDRLLGPNNSFKPNPLRGSVQVRG